MERVVTGCSMGIHSFQRANNRIFCTFCGCVKSLEIESSFLERLERVERLLNIDSGAKDVSERTSFWKMPNSTGRTISTSL